MFIYAHNPVQNRRLLFIKSTFLFVICQLPVLLFCQIVIEGPWTVECGASTNTLFKRPASFNLRYISPAFKWSEDDLTEEEEKRPEFKNVRLMAELIYTPPLKILCTGFNVQYRFVNCKRLNLEAYVGPKFFFIPGPDFITVRPLREGKEAWYFNVGLISQLNLGIIAPFADIGTDGIITIGTELNLHAIYRNPKKRYKLRKREA
jgi:hypothetical protein